MRQIHLLTHNQPFVTSECLMLDAERIGTAKERLKTAGVDPSWFGPIMEDCQDPIEWERWAAQAERDKGLEVSPMPGIPLAPTTEPQSRKRNLVTGAMFAAAAFVVAWSFWG